MESPDYYSKETLVLGCGNILFGDDGFGPDVADYILSHYNIPEDSAVLNLGLSTRGFIFDILLNEIRPRRIIIVDAMSYSGRKPGEIFAAPLDNLVKEKADDFSFHQGPASNLLKELRDLCGVEIIIIACQPQEIPKEITRGLSEPLRKAVPEASELIYNKYLSPSCCHPERSEGSRYKKQRDSSLIPPRRDSFRMAIRKNKEMVCKHKQP